MTSPPPKKTRRTNPVDGDDDGEGEMEAVEVVEMTIE